MGVGLGGEGLMVGEFSTLCSHQVTMFMYRPQLWITSMIMHPRTDGNDMALPLVAKQHVYVA